MKKILIFSLLIILNAIAFSQDGGIRSLKTIGANLVGTTTRVAIIKPDGSFYYLPNGNDNEVLTIHGGIPTYMAPATEVDYSVQHLSGTTISWNANNGINADLSISGTTDITLSNLPIGHSGTLTIFCASSAYSIKFKGYTLNISKNAIVNIAGIQTSSGSSKVDRISWYFDGTYVAIHVNYDYTITTY